MPIKRTISYAIKALAGPISAIELAVDRDNQVIVVTQDSDVVNIPFCLLKEVVDTILEIKQAEMPPNSCYSDDK